MSVPIVFHPLQQISYARLLLDFQVKIKFYTDMGFTIFHHSEGSSFTCGDISVSYLVNGFNQFSLTYHNPRVSETHVYLYEVTK